MIQRLITCNMLRMACIGALCFSLVGHADVSDSEPSSYAEHEEVIDEILITVYHSKGKEIILASDIRPGLDGSPRSLYDVLLDRLKVLDARSLGIEVSESEADQFLARIQQEHGMTKEDLEQVFAELGYTFNEGRQLLRDQQVIERIVDHRVKSDRRMLVQRADVVAYDEEHPEYISGEYTLQQAFIPRDSHTTDAVQEYVACGTIDAIAEWEPAFTISEDELAPEMRFIDTEPVGAVVDVDTTNDGTEVTRLVDKKQRSRVPVEQRYEEISNLLRRARYDEIIAEYHDRLLREASLRFAHDTDKNWIFAS